MHRNSLLMFIFGITVVYPLNSMEYPHSPLPNCAKNYQSSLIDPAQYNDTTKAVHALLNQAVKEKNKGAVDFLIKTTSKWLKFPDYYTSLDNACAQGLLSVVRFYIEECDANPHDTNKKITQYINVMHHAAQGGNPDLIYYPHQHGVPITGRHINAIHLARKPEAIDMLVSIGAQLNRGGLDAGYDKTTPLHTACALGFNNAAAHLIQQYNVNIDAFDADQETALHIVMRRDFPRLAELLLFFGADMRKKNSDNKTAFELLAPDSKILQDDICLQLIYQRIAGKNTKNDPDPECPVCLEDIKELQYDCFNWHCLHFICSLCKKTMNICPICRSPNKIPNYNIRKFLFLVE